MIIPVALNVPATEVVERLVFPDIYRLVPVALVNVRLVNVDDELINEPLIVPPTVRLPLITSLPVVVELPFTVKDVIVVVARLLNPVTVRLFDNERFVPVALVKFNVASDEAPETFKLVASRFVIVVDASVLVPVTVKLVPVMPASVEVPVTVSLAIVEVANVLVPTTVSVPVKFAELEIV